MLVIHFSGWFECRLPTDPDPCDEPRGVTGFTRALPGEPPLDRIIRFQPEPGRPRRVLAPTPTGVFVDRVLVDGTTIAALSKAPVELLPFKLVSPVFEGRNGLVFDDDQEPIVPFCIRIADKGIVIQRDHLDDATGEPVFTSPLTSNPQDDDLLFIAIGHAEPDQFISERKTLLAEATKKAAVGSIDRLALKIRYADLVGNEGLIKMFLAYSTQYRLSLSHRSAVIDDPTGALKCRPDTSPWICDFKLGAFDPDTLCGFARGTLTIPLR